MFKSLCALSLSIFLLPLSATAHESMAHAEHSHGHDISSQTDRQYPWGKAGNADQVTQTIEVSMSDLMRFEPDHLSVKQGETVRFIYHNTGVVMHEFVLGSKEELQSHAEMMAKNPDMAHGEPYMVHVAPGEKAELYWTFNRTGTFDFACLIAGHYQAGMTGTIEVQAN